MRRPSLPMTLLVLLSVCAPAFGQHASPTAGAEPLMQPEDLARVLSATGGDKPLILMVGPHSFYGEAHIPGSEYIGPSKEESGIEALKDRVKDVAHDQFVVLYCGCCPWKMCPNVRPAYQELVSLGFSRVKMLYIAKNFGADWVKKGYPVEKGR
jgi:thiosulfate/3-mercaptopyruvate sulfurtransferase